MGEGPGAELKLAHRKTDTTASIYYLDEQILLRVAVFLPNVSVIIKTSSSTELWDALYRDRWLAIQHYKWLASVRQSEEDERIEELERRRRDWSWR